ncbi:MAG TPA: PilN domain-containing protein [Longimicrobiales bacterium]
MNRAEVTVIEVNLNPGATRRSARRKGGLSLGGARKQAAAGAPRQPIDRWGLFAVLGWVVMLAGVGWMFMGARARKEELNIAIERAVRDSAHYAAVIATTERLTARRDSIVTRLRLIQEIDAGRYIWPHILDEVGRALPPYTWLTSLTQIDAGPPVAFRIEGRAGNTFALTQFMKDLEASGFIRGVRLASTQLIHEQEKVVQAFVLEATYEEPTPDRIETVPLFAAER